MNRSLLYDAVRFLPRATTPAMVVVLALRVSGHLSPGAGFLDIMILFIIGVAARMLLRSGNLKPPSP
jgi:hypothetical protein